MPFHDVKIKRYDEPILGDYTTREEVLTAYKEELIDQINSLPTHSVLDSKQGLTKAKKMIDKAEVIRLIETMV